MALLMAACTQQEELASPQAALEQPGVFKGTEGGPIDLALAHNWQQNWQKAHPELPRGLFFGREILETMLAQKGTVGLRFYPGYDEEGKLHLMMYSTDKNGNNILSDLTLVSNYSVPCPPNCPGGGGD